MSTKPWAIQSKTRSNVHFYFNLRYNRFFEVSRNTKARTWRALDKEKGMEVAGFEPASASLLRPVLHA